VQVGTWIMLVQVPKLFSGLGPARKNLLIFGNPKPIVVLAFAEVGRIAHEVLTRWLGGITAKFGHRDSCDAGARLGFNFIWPF
jgi:hypothetical protein